MVANLGRITFLGRFTNVDDGVLAKEVIAADFKVSLIMVVTNVFWPETDD